MTFSYRLLTQTSIFLLTNLIFTLSYWSLRSVSLLFINIFFSFRTKHTKTFVPSPYPTKISFLDFTSHFTRVCLVSVPLPLCTNCQIFWVSLCNNLIFFWCFVFCQTLNIPCINYIYPSVYSLYQNYFIQPSI